MAKLICLFIVYSFFLSQLALATEVSAYHNLCFDCVTHGHQFCYINNKCYTDYADCNSGSASQTNILVDCLTITGYLASCPDINVSPYGDTGGTVDQTTQSLAA